MIRQLVKDKSDSLGVQLFRYTFVGGVSFVVDFLFLYILTDFLRVHYALSAAISFIFGLIINYTLSKAWVFTTSVIKSQTMEFMIFGLIGVVGLCLNELIMVVFTELLLVYYLVSKMISTVVVYLWNFFARKLLLFR